MSKYDKKFGFTEYKETVNFHKSRRMFVVKDNELVIADAELPYSHAVWFEKEGWISDSDDNFMNTNVRGAVMADGEVRFYTGYDFKVTDEAERQFMPHLGKLVDDLNLNTNGLLSGGQVSSEGFRPRKKYGKISDNLV